MLSLVQLRITEKIMYDIISEQLVMDAYWNSSSFIGVKVTRDFGEVEEYILLMLKIRRIIEHHQYYWSSPKFPRYFTTFHPHSLCSWTLKNWDWVLSRSRIIGFEKFNDKSDEILDYIKSVC